MKSENEIRERLNFFRALAKEKGVLGMNGKKRIQALVWELEHILEEEHEVLK